jgi:hypothetical protein
MKKFLAASESPRYRRHMTSDEDALFDGDVELRGSGRAVSRVCVLARAGELG